ncbi:LysM peptidoglycan-binding domain-containing protein [Nosocomiicoccus ampullae]|uniref:LysM repeat protein/surface antigen n=1 Tax=Nosocomiicoccus ampullae TaxID=489910 RepID=A0A9Q2CZD0_9STAP|nr:LysM peptidoglycan-binding domain-containing protein [Nosocomiicoccus ampullae]MBB5175727.1 LysM repeat protein/surface antigen [Nosocomiicoccus ampullae]QYA47117.1 LysM peptidoglycan-binding domain-containing protein [Nosocomiicoccus ampullae]
MKKTVFSVATITALTGTSLTANAEEVIVKEGDTLWGIANEVGTTVEALKQANNLKSDLIKPEDVLTYDLDAEVTYEEDAEGSYTVRSGDTLWSIAEQFGVSLDELYALNNLSSDLIHPGLVLNVGGEVASAPAVNEVEVEEVEKVELPAENAEVEEVEVPAASGAYVVEAGDTLYSIARATGVSIDELKALNGLSSDLITVGQVLVLEGAVEEVEVVEENNDVEAVEEDNVVVEEVTEEANSEDAVETEEIVEENNEVEVAEESQNVNEEAEAEVRNAAQAVKEAERAEQERVEAERAEAAQAVAEAERAEQERVEAERAAAAKAVEEAERAEQERVAAERAAAEQAEAERLAAERAEAKRAAQAVAEAERAEQERLAAEQEAQQAQQAEQQNQPAASAPVNNASQNFAGQTNHYLYGWCAWYAFEQRAALGKPVSNMWGDANNWAASASADGFTVSNSPSVGAIAQSYAGSNGAGGSGHVAIVESIHGDGSITVSEMGWNGSVGTATYRTIPASQVSSHNFIH